MAPAAGIIRGGGAGDDTLVGSGSADTLRGGGGDDLVIGGNGDDSLTGGAGSDEIWGERIVSLIEAGWMEPPDAGLDFGRDVIWGGDGDDRIRPGMGGDTVFGGRGDDVLVGGDGDDLLDLAGAARAYGGDGADLFLLAGDDEGLRKRIIGFDPAEDRLRFDAGDLSVSGTSIDLVDRGAGRLDDVRLRIEIGGGTVVQDLLLVGVDDTAGIAVQFV